MIAVASMVGIIPTIGFVAKEGALAALLHEALGGSPWGIVALDRRGARFRADGGLRHPLHLGRVLDEEGRRRLAAARAPSGPIRRSGSSSAPVVLSGLTVVAGFAAPLLDTGLRAATPTRHRAPRPASPPPEHPAHLALWHGFEPALWISLGTIAVGVLVFWLTARIPLDASACCPSPLPRSTTPRSAASRGSSVVTTSLTQRGSLPVYVGTIFVVFVAAEGTALLAGGELAGIQLDAFQTPIQLVVAPIMIAAGLIAVRARKRYTGVVLVSVTGLGMVLLFATSGAPDLALTQILVETVTLVAFALVLRRIPARLGEHNASVWPVARAVLGAAVGVTMAARRARGDGRAHGEAHLGRVGPSSPTSSATARTSSTSPSSTCAAGTPWASCRC